jgi:NAD(P)-dependent dehydrogenase (short-subunit alcohol dehydrogenase family)
VKTILITGTTNGIGRVTALELAHQGHRLVMANRNRDKSEKLRTEILNQTGNEAIEILDLDLASLDSVKRCTEAFLANHDKLDLLINNAGLMSMDEVITMDGYELQFAVNALSQLQFTLHLVPALAAAAPSHVIFVTSMMHKFGKLDPDSFRGWQKYHHQASYNQSKLVMTMLARELADRLGDRGIKVNSLHPGAVNTGILDDYGPVSQFLLRLIFTAPEKGARTTLHLAGLDPAQAPSGQYFTKGKPAATHKLVDDAASRSRLWETCTGLLEAP